MDASDTSGPKIKVPKCAVTGFFSSHFQTIGKKKILFYLKAVKT